MTIGERLQSVDVYSIRMHMLYMLMCYMCVCNTEYWVVTILAVGILSKCVEFLWVLVLYLLRELKHSSNKIKTRRHLSRHFTAVQN